MSTGDLFASDPIYWLHVNNAICGNPQSLIVNTGGGFSAYPTARSGCALSNRLNRQLTLHLGAYQVSAADVATSQGLDWSITSQDGLLLIAQRDLNRRLNPVGDGPTSTARDRRMGNNAFAGAFLNLYQMPGFGAAPDSSSVYGFYLHLDRELYHKPRTPGQGLRAWAAASLILQPNVARLPLQLNSGLVYTGLIPARDRDLSTLGRFPGRFSRDYLLSTPSAAQAPVSAMPGYELVMELDHRFVVSPSIDIQPNLQIVVNPAGTGSLATALVLAAQAGIRF